MRLFSILICFIALSTVSVAAQPAMGEGQRWLRARIVIGSGQGPYAPMLRDVTRTLVGTFARSANDRGVVTADSLALSRRRALTEAWRQLLSQAYALDTDGDGAIDRDELAVGARSAHIQTPRGFLDELGRADANDDGRIDVVEIQALVHRWIEARRPPFNRFYPALDDLIPLDLDRNGDGQVTRDEVDAATEEAFASIDTDHDGRLSLEERSAVETGAFLPEPAEEDRRSRGVALGVGVPMGYVSSARSPAEAVDRWFRAHLTMPGTTLERALERLRQTFNGSAGGSDHVTAATLERVSAQRSAAWRAYPLASVLSHDLDGDGVIERRELDEVAGTSSPRLTRLSAHALLVADTDLDGRITLSEALAYAQRVSDASRSALDVESVSVPMSLDRDGDGRVSWDEFETAAREAFAAMDVDGDGKLSREEIQAALRR